MITVCVPVCVCVWWMTDCDGPSFTVGFWFCSRVEVKVKNIVGQTPPLFVSPALHLVPGSQRTEACCILINHLIDWPTLPPHTHTHTHTHTNTHTELKSCRHTQLIKLHRSLLMKERESCAALHKVHNSWFCRFIWTCTRSLWGFCSGLRSVCHLYLCNHADKPTTRQNHKLLQVVTT